MKHPRVTMAERAIREMKQAETADDFTYHLYAFFGLLYSLEQISRSRAQHKGDRDANAYYAAVIGLRNVDVHVKAIETLRTIHIGATDSRAAQVERPPAVRFTFSIAVPDDPTFMKGWPMKSAAVTWLSECEAVAICEKALAFFVDLVSGSDESGPGQETA